MPLAVQELILWEDIGSLKEGTSYRLSGMGWNLIWKRLSAVYGNLMCVRAHMCVYHRCQQMDTPFSLDPMIAMDLVIPDATGSARTDTVGGYRVTEGRHIVQAVRNGMESDLEAIVYCVWKPDVCVRAHMCVYHRCQQMDTPFSLDPMIAMCWCTPCR